MVDTGLVYFCARGTGCEFKIEKEKYGVYLVTESCRPCFGGSGVHRLGVEGLMGVVGPVSGIRGWIDALGRPLGATIVHTDLGIFGTDIACASGTKSTSMGRSS